MHPMHEANREGSEEDEPEEFEADIGAGRNEEGVCSTEVEEEEADVLKGLNAGNEKRMDRSDEKNQGK